MATKVLKQKVIKASKDVAVKKTKKVVAREMTEEEFERYEEEKEASYYAEPDMSNYDEEYKQSLNNNNDKDAHDIYEQEKYEAEERAERRYRSMLNDYQDGFYYQPNY